MRTRAWSMWSKKARMAGSLRLVTTALSRPRHPQNGTGHGEPAVPNGEAKESRQLDSHTSRSPPRNETTSAGATPRTAGPRSASNRTPCSSSGLTTRHPWPVTASASRSPRSTVAPWTGSPSLNGTPAMIRTRGSRCRPPDPAFRDSPSRLQQFGVPGHSASSSKRRVATEQEGIRDLLGAGQQAPLQTNSRLVLTS